MYSSRRLEELVRVPGARQRAPLARGLSRLPARPTAKYPSHKRRRRAVRAAIFSTVKENVASRPPRARERQEEKMSTVIEPNASQGSPSAFEITGAAPAAAEVIGLNARRVIAKRYSLKDSQGEPIEEWPDIVRRVVGHVAQAETRPRQARRVLPDDGGHHAPPRVRPEHALPRQRGQALGAARRLLRPRRARLHRRHHEDRDRRRHHPPDGRRHRLHLREAAPRRARWCARRTASPRAPCRS